MKTSRNYELLARSENKIIVVDEGRKGIRVFELGEGQESNMNTIRQGFENLEEVEQKYGIENSAWIESESYSGKYEYYNKIV